MANSRTPSDEITKEGFGIHARRAIAYIFLILITILFILVLCTFCKCDQNT